MRLFSTKALRFDAQGMDSVYIQARSFATVPDWVESTRLYELALKDGTIEVVNGAAASAEIEKAMADNMPVGPKRSRVTGGPAEAVS